jgi:hypothetical protein
MNSDPTRTCPFCAEVIRATAKVCPRCRQWLSLRSFRNPVVSLFAIGLPALVCCGILLVVVFSRFDRLFNPRPHYSEMPDALLVLESRMNWVETTNGPRIYVTGILTNRSAVAWREVEFECRFFGTNGIMVDADHARGWLTILPNDDCAFRAMVAPGRPAADYHALKVSVSTARNARGPF